MVACAYCSNDRKLCVSHAIPDGFFKLISRKNNGKLITIPKGSGRIHLDQDTGGAELLCKECESLFNRQFDSPIVNAFKAWDRKIIQEGFDVQFEFSANQMAQCLASIFWRASESGNDMYVDAKVNHDDKAQLLSIVKGEQNKALKLCSCSIRRIYDKRTPSSGGFSQEHISQIILPVNAYRLSWKHKKPVGYFGFSVLMQGFLCHLMVPRLPFGKRSGPGFLTPNNNKLRAPKQYFLEYKPLMDAMVVGVGKHLEGQSNLKK